MKKLLYITANSKDEQESSSKTIGRRLVNAILQKNQDLELQELDLYKEHIPRLKSNYFNGRNSLVNSDEQCNLSIEEQQEIQKIEGLCNQFIEADIYVLAAPMWSLSFPAPVKEYIDCIVQTGKTIEFESYKPYGLLGDKHRIFIYVQSSGGKIPWILRSAFNKGLNYVHEIVRFMGVDIFEELLVDGTGITKIEQRDAIESATKKIESIVNKL
ncbi:MAG: FMN-dependent NADH-azoreductase [Lachnospiraceae bacterium]